MSTTINSAPPAVAASHTPQGRGDLLGELKTMLQDPNTSPAVIRGQIDLIRSRHQNELPAEMFLQLRYLEMACESLGGESTSQNASSRTSFGAYGPEYRFQYGRTQVLSLLNNVEDSPPKPPEAPKNGGKNDGGFEKAGSDKGGAPRPAGNNVVAGGTIRTTSESLKHTDLLVDGPMPETVRAPGAQRNTTGNMPRTEGDSRPGLTAQTASAGVRTTGAQTSLIAGRSADIGVFGAAASGIPTQLSLAPAFLAEGAPLTEAKAAFLEVATLHESHQTLLADASMMFLVLGQRPLVGQELGILGRLTQLVKQILQGGRQKAVPLETVLRLNGDALPKGVLINAKGVLQALKQALQKRLGVLDNLLALLTGKGQKGKQLAKGMKSPAGALAQVWKTIENMRLLDNLFGKPKLESEKDSAQEEEVDEDEATSRKTRRRTAAQRRQQQRRHEQEARQDEDDDDTEHDDEAPAKNDVWKARPAAQPPIQFKHTRADHPTPAVETPTSAEIPMQTQQRPSETAAEHTPTDSSESHDIPTEDALTPSLPV